MKPAFIDDSVVFSARYEHPAQSVEPVEFAYRPLTARQVTAYRREISGSVDDAIKATVRLVARHVKGWNIRKPNGECVSTTNEADIERIEHRVLFGIVELMLDSRNVEATEEAAKNC